MVKTPRSRDIAGVVLVALAVVGASCAQCHNVVPGNPPEPTFERASRSPRFAIQRGGQPAGKTFVSISPYGTKGEVGQTFVSDAHGGFAAPRLPVGRYMVGASDFFGNGALLLVEVQRAFGEDKTLTLDLHPAPVSRSQPSEPVEAGPISEFGGTVNDPTGTPIPHATILIAETRDPGQRTAIRWSSDDRGRFAGDLPKGTYLARVSAPGFAVRVVNFTIAPGGPGDLHVRLNIGAVC